MSAPERGGTPGLFLPWDSEFFGFRIGRVQGNRLTRESLRPVLDWAAAERLRCAYFFADAEDAATLALAHEGGFRFVDLRVDLAMPLPAGGALPAVADFRAAATSDLPALQAISRVAHYDTRFFKDAGFPRERASDLYAEWIQRDFRVHHVFTLPGNPGYVTCQVDPAAGAGRIGLIAVAEAQRGRGLGRALVQGALHWLAAQGCREARVATQASNVAAQRLYQALGFRTAETAATHHRWF
ncbi:MAG TPA: GNAT family N-acetyltransferase [Lacunisphaera sp.]|nr:GNAT family N-acetyltransferase [Lacunisphaera sp.]